MKLLKILILTFAYFMPCNNHGMGLFGRVLNSVRSATNASRPLVAPKQTYIDLPHVMDGSNVEAVCFKKNGDLLSSEEHKKVYQIILNNSFVTGNMRDDYDPTTSDITKIQKCLEKEGMSDINVIGIPRTFYELVYRSIPTSSRQDILLPYDSDLIYDNTKNCLKFNETELCRRAHAQCNNEVIHVLNEFKNSKKDKPTDERFASIAKEIRSRIGPEARFARSHEHDELIRKAIQLDTNHAGQHMLYRGRASATKPEFSENASETAKRSISLGTSLLASGEPGSCAYNYMTQTVSPRSWFEKKQPNQTNYAIPISKAEYAHNGILSKFFHIPSLATHLALRTTGDFHHARTKVAVSSDTLVKDVKGMEKNFGNRHVPEHLIIPGNTDEQHKTVRKGLNYIINNAIPLNDYTASRLQQVQSFGQQNGSATGDEL